MDIDPRRQGRRRYPVPPGMLDVDTAAELLRLSVPTVRRRTYSGELSVVGRRSDVGVLLDKEQVEQLAAAYEAGELPRDRRRLNGKQGRTPSKPMAERELWRLT